MRRTENKNPKQKCAHRDQHLQKYRQKIQKTECLHSDAKIGEIPEKAPCFCAQDNQHERAG